MILRRLPKYRPKHVLTSLPIALGVIPLELSKNFTKVSVVCRQGLGRQYKCFWPIIHESLKKYTLNYVLHYICGTIEQVLGSIMTSYSVEGKFTSSVLVYIS